MLTVITALYAEAKPYIEHYHAKKNTKETICQEFVSENVRILVTGSGAMAACAAITRYFTRYPAKPSDLLVNIGIAAAAGDFAETDVRSGTPFLITKLTEAATGRTFFPDLLFQNDFSKAEIITCPKPIDREQKDMRSFLSGKIIEDGNFQTAQEDSDFRAAQPLLADSEAAAVYQAALPYISPERMFFIKIISHRIDSEEKQSVDPYELIQPTVEVVRAFFSNLSVMLEGEFPQKPVMSEETSEQIAEIYKRLSLTVSMREDAERLFRYCHRNGISLTGHLRQYLLELPEEIHGKKDSMAYFSMLRERLLEGIERESGLPCTEKPEEKRTGYLPFFSTVYVEEKVQSDKRISDFLKKRNDSSVISIQHYKDVFNRNRQNCVRQKKAPSLILAKQEGTLIYPGAPVCQSFGNQHFYYTSNIMNCIYHCDYCYLQGMYPSGHLVVFVNQEDSFAELDLLLRQHPVYLCVSYDTDLLALEGMFHFVERWIAYAAGHPSLTLEIRTKSGNPEVFQRLAAGVPEDVPERVVFSWTLSPENHRRRYEHGTAPLSVRLLAARAAADAGFPVRFCFDPMIFTPGWKQDYRCLLSRVFQEVSPELLNDVSVGVFRISSGYLKQMRKNCPNNTIVAFPFVSENGVSHYGKLSGQMTEFMREELLRYLPEEKLFFWENTD